MSDESGLFGLILLRRSIPDRTNGGPVVNGTECFVANKIAAEVSSTISYTLPTYVYTCASQPYKVTVTSRGRGISAVRLGMAEIYIIILCDLSSVCMGCMASIS